MCGDLLGETSANKSALLSNPMWVRFPLLRALNVVADLDELPHPRVAGRIILAVAVVGRGCSDDAVARVASMPVDAVRAVIPAMVDRHQHVPPLLTAKVIRRPLQTAYIDIRLRREAQSRIIKLCEYISCF